MVKSAFTEDDDALLAELGVEVEDKKAPARTPRQERIIAGFEEIQRFVVNEGRLPSMAEGNDIFERIYATRLEQIRNQQECRDVLEEMDHQGLLSESAAHETDAAEEFSDDELLAELGVDVAGENDVTNLRHVRSTAERKAAESIASRAPCVDFEEFKPIFEKVHNELKDGSRKTRPYEIAAEIRTGNFFILGGLVAYVADMGELYINDHGMSDARLRLIFDNGTESNMLLRSLQRALNGDEAGRRITNPEAGPLFSGELEDDDTSSGTIYVLRSKSEDPNIKDRREVLHKIGVTGGSVEKRVANAAFDATFLLADVEIVATYELFNINRTKLENLIHKIFDSARLDIVIQDRFGQPVKPREWFLVPLFIIDEAVQKIMDGSIADYAYDIHSAALKKPE